MTTDLKTAAVLNDLAVLIGGRVSPVEVDAAAYAVEVRRRGPPDRSTSVVRVKAVVALLVKRRRLALLQTFIHLLVENADLRAKKQGEPLPREFLLALRKAMRALGLDTGGLPRAPRSRNGFVSTSGVPSAAPAPARRHDDLLATFAELVGLHATEPQAAGRKLNGLMHAVLRAERLSPAGSFFNPGEEIDGAFMLDGNHYLLECKWEAAPVGLPAVRKFKDIVSTKVEGTFGVFLSMSGYVSGIDEKVARGARLNTTGLEARHLVLVLEGRTTWTAIVRAAKMQAARHSTFCFEG